MQRDPEKLADWVGNLVRNNPESDLAWEVARTFGTKDNVQENLVNTLSNLLDKDAIKRATKESQLKHFKVELLENGEVEKFLCEALLDRMRQKGLVDREEANHLIEQLSGAKEK